LQWFIEKGIIKLNIHFHVPYLYLISLKPFKINNSLFLYRKIATGMEKSLKASLLDLHPFDEMQIQMLENKITLQTLASQSRLYQQKNIACEIHYIILGSIRQFVENESDSQTIQFYTEGDLFNCFENFWWFYF